jgi:hypothetical protein
MRNAYKNFIPNFKERRPRGRWECKWEDSIEIRCDDIG